VDELFGTHSTTRCRIILVARVASLTQVRAAADFWNPTG
jgi:hypothetical protein